MPRSVTGSDDARVKPHAVARNDLAIARGDARTNGSGGNKSHRRKDTEACEARTIHRNQPASPVISAIFTSRPPSACDFAAASMIAKSSSVSSGSTGTTPVLKNGMIAFFSIGS